MPKNDSLLLGLLVGLLTPSIPLLLFYLLQEADQTSLWSFVSLLNANNLLMPVLSLCALVNLGLFFLFLRQQRSTMARGIILATMVYAVAVALYKLL